MMLKKHLQRLQQKRKRGNNHGKRKMDSRNAHEKGRTS